MNRNSISTFEITLLLTLLTLITLSIMLVDANASDESNDYPVEVVRLYGREAREYPEGITTDQNGTIYVSINANGEIWKQPADGSAPILLTSFGVENPLGMAVDKRGNLYVALRSYDPNNQGVYHVDTTTGAYRRLHGTDAIGHPNAVVFDRRGNLYVTDSIMGAIWRIKGKHLDSDEVHPKLWLMHPVLQGLQLSISPYEHHIGANGMAYWDHGLYISNTEKAQISYIPIKRNGRPGKPRVVVENIEELLPLDGITLDVHGRIYACINYFGNKVVRINPNDGSIVTVADFEDGLDYPASVAFGRGADDNRSLYVVNYTKWASEGIGPGVLRIDIDEQGYFLPGY